MNKTFLTGVMAIVTAILLVSCAGPDANRQYTRTSEQPSALTIVNHQTFADDILNYKGPAVVLFYNTQFWQCMDMKWRLEWLEKKYRGKAKFAMFHWQVSDDPSRFGLEMLPTVILYRNGAEIDRIKGIPPESKDRAAWNDDLELWFLKNALTLESSDYAADYTYFFKNGYTLQVGNF